MEKDIFIVTDNSGSMGELSKKQILEHSIRFLSELPLLFPIRYKEVSFQFFSWNSSVFQTEFTQESVPVITPRDKADAGKLIEWLTAASEKNEITGSSGGAVYALLFTDGNIPKEDLSKFSTWLKEQKSIIIRCIGAGVDARPASLPLFSSNGTSYEVSQIAAALDSLILGCDLQVQPPAAISMLVQVNNNESEPDWDE